MQNVDFNESIYNQNPLFNLSSDVKSICQPLFDNLNINYFDYNRFNDDNSYVGLTSDAEWVEHFFKAKYPLGCTLKDSGMHLWQSYVPESLIHNAKTYYQHDHGVSIFYKKDGYIEYFDFAAAPENRQVLSTYYNNEVLERFCQYFLDRGSKLISQVVNHPIYIPNNMRGTLIPELEIKTLPFNDNLYRLTDKQIHCLYYLVSGMTVRQAALKLELSSRTVEHYVEHLKIKLGCSSRAELIQKALQINLIRDLL